MGSQSSRSSSCSNSGWTNHGYCSCSQTYYNVQKVRWKSVPLGGQGWVMTGRILSLGISQFWGKGKEYSHDVIQIWVRCSMCSRSMYVTMQFSDIGKQLRWGRYQKIKSGSNAVVQVNRSYRYSYAKEKYNQMGSSGYSLANFNCKDWARCLWNKL